MDVRQVPLQSTIRANIGVGDTRVNQLIFVNNLTTYGTHEGVPESAGQNSREPCAGFVHTGITVHTGLPSRWAIICPQSPLQTTVSTTPLSTTLPVTLSKRGCELLDALEDMVLREGFADLGVSEIATRLSCSKRTLYELAPSKRELVLLVLQRFFARIRRDAANACEHASDAQQRIYAYLQAGVRAAENLSATTVTDIHRWPPARAIWQDHVRLRVEGLSKLIDSGTRAGVFREIPPAFVAEVVFASINRLREPDFYESTDLTISEAFDELYSMLLAALTPFDEHARETVSRREASGFECAGD